MNGQDENNDSISEASTLGGFIKSVRMKMDADTEDKLCFILVEGDDDVAFINIVKSERTVHCKSPYGKKGVFDAMQNKLLADKRVIAICDRDYDDASVYTPPLFCYDRCNLETMMLSCKDVCDGLLRQYKGHHGNAFVLNAARQLAPLSMARAKNATAESVIDFKKSVLLHDGVIDQNETIDNEKLFGSIGQEKMLSKCIENAEKIEDSELLDWTNGHDLCAFLGQFCSNLNKKGKLGEDGVFYCLIMLYRLSDFKQTRLYHELKAYEKRSGLFIVREVG